MGRGEPVVLVHGLSGSMRWWKHVAPVLARQYRVYLIDLPGFGSMRHLGNQFVLRDAAGWLAAWMDAVGLTGASGTHLVGHSMGAYICLMLAAQHPDKVDRLVLVDLAGVPTKRRLAGYLLPLAADVLLSVPSLLQVLVRDALRAGPRTLWRTANDLMREDVRAILHKIQAPSLIVWGEKDTLMPPAAGKILRREIARSRLVTIPGARHVPMLDRPVDFNRTLLAFLAGEDVGK